METPGSGPALETLKSGGVEAKAISSLYFHAKMVLADYETPDQIAYIGSEIFGHVSLDQNRELGILLRDTLILDPVESIFSQDWLVPGDGRDIN